MNEMLLNQKVSSGSKFN
jgi:hypothetical protein